MLVQPASWRDKDSPQTRPVLPAVGKITVLPEVEGAAGAPGDLFSPCHCGSGPARHVSRHMQACGLLCELPKKRRRAEVSAPTNWQHDAIGTHKPLNTDLRSLSWVSMSPAFSSPRARTSGVA